jgi:hypothetical protein
VRRKHIHEAENPRLVLTLMLYYSIFYEHILSDKDALTSETQPSTVQIDLSMIQSEQRSSVHLLPCRGDEYYESMYRSE